MIVITRNIFTRKKRMWNDIKRYQNKSHNDNVQKKNAIIVFGLYIELSVYRYEFPSNTGC